MVTMDMRFPAARSRAVALTEWCSLPVAFDILLRLRRKGDSVWFERKE